MFLAKIASFLLTTIDLSPVVDIIVAILPVMVLLALIKKITRD